MKFIFEIGDTIKLNTTVDGRYSANDSGKIDSYTEDNGNTFYNVKSSGELINKVPESHLTASYEGTEKEVNRILDEREKNKTFKDSDVRISGTRKELAAYKGLISISDFDEFKEDKMMVNKLIKKDRIYPKINIDEEISNGVTGGAVYLKNYLRTKIASSPSTDENIVKMYIGLCQYLYDIMNTVKTVTDYVFALQIFKKNCLRKAIVILNPDLGSEVEKQLNDIEDLKIDVNVLSKQLNDINSEILIVNKQMFIDKENSEHRIKYEKLREEQEYLSELIAKMRPISSGELLPIEREFFISINSIYLYPDKLIEGVLGDKFSKYIFSIDIFYNEEKTEWSIFNPKQSIWGSSWKKESYDKESLNISEPFKEAIKYESKDIEHREYLLEKFYFPYQVIKKKGNKYREMIDFFEAKKSPEQRKAVIDYFNEVPNQMVNTLNYKWNLVHGWTASGYGNWSKLINSKSYERAYKLLELLRNKRFEKEYNSFVELQKSVYSEYPTGKNDYSFFGQSREVKRTTDLVINTGKPLDFIKRDNGVAVYEDDLNDEDKFKSFYKNQLAITRITFGVSLTDAERLAHGRHFASSLIDLAEALDSDVKTLISAGDLGILFGASGRGRYAAHYERMNKAINLTRRNGQGTLAHEFAHYLDNIMGGGESTYITEKIFNITENKTEYSEIEKAAFVLMNFIFNGVTILELDKEYSGMIDANKELYISLAPLFNEMIEDINSESIYKTITVEDGFSKVFEKKESFEKHLESILTEYPNLFDSMYSIERTWRDEMIMTLLNTYGIKQHRFEMQYNIKYINKKYQDAEGKYHGTKYHMNAEAMNSLYWSKNVELFARAFETYMFDKLLEKNKFNNYLVSGSYFDREEGIYPSGVERQILFVLFDNLLNAFKKEMNVVAFTAFRPERENEYILLSKDDTESDSVIVDATEEFESEDDTESKKEEGLKFLEQVMESLNKIDNMEDGGEMCSNCYINHLSKFATV